MGISTAASSVHCHRHLAITGWLQAIQGSKDQALSPEMSFQLRLALLYKRKYEAQAHALSSSLKTPHVARFVTLGIRAVQAML